LRNKEEFCIERKKKKNIPVPEVWSLLGPVLEDGVPPEFRLH